MQEGCTNRTVHWVAGTLLGGFASNLNAGPLDYRAFAALVKGESLYLGSRQVAGVGGVCANAQQAGWWWNSVQGIEILAGFVDSVSTRPSRPAPLG
jgi:hypothetical protein